MIWTAQLDSSLVYTKENRKNDVDLDEEDKELLFDQTEQFVESKPIIDYKEPVLQEVNLEDKPASDYQELVEEE